MAMGKKVIFISAVTLLMCTVAFGLRLRLEQARLAQRMVRLHVVANSDAPADQGTKLLVRDRILPMVAELTAEAENAKEAELALRMGLDRIQALAQDTLRCGAAAHARWTPPGFRRMESVLSRDGAGDQGMKFGAQPCAAIWQSVRMSCRSVRVTLTEEHFPRRDYETFSLPAGRYTALRITLGEGKGHNWWCVAFPALCLPATVDGFDEAAVEAGLDNGQIRLITSDDEDVQIKFRILEWIEELFG